MLFVFDARRISTGVVDNPVAIDAASEAAAIRAALRVAKNADGRAVLGTLGKTIYPDGPDGNRVWLAPVPMPEALARV